jgi:hypothetical protein
MFRPWRPLALTFWLAACAGEEFSAPEASSSNHFTGAAGGTATGGLNSGGERNSTRGGAPDATTGGTDAQTSGGVAHPSSGGADSSTSGGNNGEAGNANVEPCPLGFTGPACEEHVHACRDLPASAPSGSYVIDPDGTGPLPAFEASCDMENGGGGWTLILNYVHKGATNPTLSPRKDSLPVLGSDALGSDESTEPANWGHAAPSLVAALAPKALRFYGRIALRDALIDFSTNDSGCLGYASGANSNCKGVTASATLLPDHSASLPGVATAFMAGKGDYALTEFPFYLGGQAHWAIRGEGQRWEVDNTPVAGVAKNLYDTIHRVWLR